MEPARGTVTTDAPDVTSYFIIDKENKNLILNTRNKQDSIAVL